MAQARLLVITAFRTYVKNERAPDPWKIGDSKAAKSCDRRENAAEV
jgi:hypothetical protein